MIIFNTNDESNCNPYEEDMFDYMEEGDIDIYYLNCFNNLTKIEVNGCCIFGNIGHLSSLYNLTEIVFFDNTNLTGTILQCENTTKIDQT